jgi:two-component system, OmpR family, phosphate regulon sensor histidine kinase PhoR
VSVASQLRLAIGILVAALIAILAAAFYVPQQLEQSATEKYVEDAIPLRELVQDLVLQVVNQEAAVEAYLVTRHPDRLRRYVDAQAAANADLARMTPHVERHPELERLRQDAVILIADLQGLFERQIRANEGQPNGEGSRPTAEIDRKFQALRRVSALMLTETDRFVREATEEQRETYRQLLVVLAGLGTIALGVGASLFFLTPRRVGQLYAAERESRREAESRSDAARALAHVSDGVVLTDDEGRVRFWNPAAEKLTGIAEHGAAGRELAKLLPGWERLTRQPDALGGVGGAAVFPIQLGHERWLSVTSVDFGEGVVYAIRDVTEERGLERLRSEFVATASHELRTPMTSISGAARTLLRRDTDLEPEQHRSLLEMIVEESDRLARIVDQILLASRIEAGELDVVAAPCDAREIVGSVLDTARLRAPRGIELVLDAPDDVSAVACDSDRLRQVLVNLVDNAIKYSPGGGEVRVELAESHDMLRFAVHDEGLGFDPARADELFERFRRLDPHLTYGIGGTGLGLYICRELVRRMGGSIWAHSEPGQGSSFVFELPLAVEGAEARQHFGTAG